MRCIRFSCLVLIVLFFSTCKKVQPVPSKLSGDWQLAKTYNAAYLTTNYYTTGSGYCFKFNDKEYSTECKGGAHKAGKRYTFTPDANNPDNGQIKFSGKMDPDTYHLTWDGDTLILTPSSPVYDVKYYIRSN
ncbi:MAG TPA: hypothetical protein VFJ43_06590 [Bacteroidia bacterium]|nr:hypothetical protein [Bacteroidia bacterium]